jgi:hypothetical protein
VRPANFRLSNHLRFVRKSASSLGIPATIGASILQIAKAIFDRL